MAKQKVVIYEPPPPPGWVPGRAFGPDDLVDQSRQGNVLSFMESVHTGLREFTDSQVFKPNEIPHWEHRGNMGENFGAVYNDTVRDFNRMSNQGAAAQAPQQIAPATRKTKMNENESYLDYIGAAPSQPAAGGIAEALATTEHKLTIIAQILGETYKLNKAIIERLDAIAATRVSPAAAMGFPATPPREAVLTAENLQDVDLEGLRSPREEAEAELEAMEAEAEDVPEPEEAPAPAPKPARKPARKPAK